MTAPLTMSIADKAIAFALAQVGKPYVWGATGPDAYDCSGLIYAAYRAAGYMAITRTTYTQIGQGTPIANGNELPGDLIFPDAGHVIMYIGNGQIVEAPHTGENVRVGPNYAETQNVGIRRLVSPGDAQVAAAYTQSGIVPSSLGGLISGTIFQGTILDYHVWYHFFDVIANWLFYSAIIMAGITAAGIGMVIMLAEHPSSKPNVNRAIRYGKRTIKEVSRGRISKDANGE